MNLPKLDINMVFNLAIGILLAMLVSKLVWGHRTSMDSEQESASLLELLSSGE